MGRGRMSWAESMEGSRGTREGDPLQRKERGEEPLGTGALVGMSSIGEKGIAPNAGSRTWIPQMES